MNPNEHLEVKRLLDVFTDRPCEVLDSEAQAERRTRVVSHIQQLLSATHPEPVSLVHRIRWPQTAATLALAAGLALVIGRYVPWGKEVTPVASLRTLTNHGEILCDRNDGRSWTPCDPKQTQGVVGWRTLAGASLSIETLIGVHVALEPSSTLLLSDAAPAAKSSEVTLTEGRIDVKVPKLGQGRQFSVLTPNATITVHGTAFTVTVRRAESQTSRTCVELREGVISVDSEGRVERLIAPARFGCDKTPVSSVATQAEPTTTTTTTEIAPPPAVNTDTARPRYTLAQETRLLQTALGAERRKDFATAEKSLRSLLSTYPNSVVAPEARAALERIGVQNRLKTK